MKKRFVLGCLLVLSILAIPLVSFASMEAVYKVFVVNSEGTPASEPANVTVSFYDSASGGSPYWSESQTITPESGLYILDLGKTNPFHIPLDMTMYLGVTVGSAEASSRMVVNGAGSFSQKGGANFNNALNIRYQWLDILGQ